MLQNQQRSFKTKINDRDIWDYVIPQKIKIEGSSLSEMENARIFCGIPIDVFEALPGTNFWASDETTIGIYESKSDVLAFYRTERMKEAVINFIQTEEIRKGGK